MSLTSFHMVNPPKTLLGPVPVTHGTYPSLLTLFSPPSMSFVLIPSSPFTDPLSVLETDCIFVPFLRPELPFYYLSQTVYGSTRRPPCRFHLLMFRPSVPLYFEPRYINSFSRLCVNSIRCYVVRDISTTDLPTRTTVATLYT